MPGLRARFESPGTFSRCSEIQGFEADPEFVKTDERWAS